MTPSDVWTTSNMGLAAYAMVQGLTLLGVAREKERFSFRLSDPERRREQLRVDFANSEVRKFDEAIKTLKDICFGDRSSRS